MNVSASVDAGKAAPGSTVLIKSFDDLRPHMKGFLRRVHPDTIHGENDTVKDQNHESLLLLDAMFKGLEARCELCARPKKGADSLPTISDVYQLKFFWIDRAAKDALSVMSYKASMPMSLDGQTRLVVSRAVASTTLHNEWLHVAATHMGKLLSGVGVPSDLRGPRPVDKSKPRLFKVRAA